MMDVFHLLEDISFLSRRIGLDLHWGQQQRGCIFAQPDDPTDCQKYLQISGHFMWPLFAFSMELLLKPAYHTLKLSGHDSPAFSCDDSHVHYWKLPIAFRLYMWFIASQIPCGRAPLKCRH
jgi:hypothetical protein